MNIILATLAMSAINPPQYYCVAEPLPCQNLTLITSWQYRYDHLVVNGHDYGRVVSANYKFGAVPASVIVPDEIFDNGFN